MHAISAPMMRRLTFTGHWDAGAAQHRQLGGTRTDALLLLIARLAARAVRLAAQLLLHAAEHTICV